MNVYCYKAPGTSVDGVRTKEVFQGYVESGMTALYLTGNNSYCLHGEEPWEDSVSKQCFELAREVGIGKVILRDNRLYEDLIQEKDMLVGEGEGYRFASESELDEYVRDCMKDYIREEGLYGVGLLDEPSWKHVKSYGLVYRSIKRVAKEFGFGNIYIQMNINPMIFGAYSLMHPDYLQMTEREAYEAYLDAFLSSTGADIVSVDNYPFRPSYIGGRFLDGYYTCFQILGKKCVEYGATLAFVLQSFEMIHKTIPTATAGFRRVTSVNEMFLQMNSALGFGVRDISFYTYETWRIPADHHESCYRMEDGSAFITTTGEKTRIYYYAKAAIEHAKALEGTLFQYGYAGARLSVHESLKSCEKNYLQCEGMLQADGTLREPRSGFDNSHTFARLERFSHDRDVLLITELKKEDNEGYLYMALNVIDSPYKLDLAPMKTRLRFADGVKAAKVFRSERWETIELNDGGYETELVPGEAVYLIPLE